MILRSVHENLSYKPQDPYVAYDLRFSTDNNLDFPQMNRDYNYIDFAQLATNPPINEMRLFHPLLPWYIDVVESQPNGITIQDVFMQMFMQLNVSIMNHHFYNEDLQANLKERIYQAFIARTNGDRAEQELGVKRVDFLQGKVVFVGLVRAKNGHWEMKTKNPP
ncbi:hypothetical protein C0991_003677 [Blastosporella zonata]|nr:hypothetical protein C0991_003677 [Blastosporella zonata]